MYPKKKQIKLTKAEQLAKQISDAIRMIVRNFEQLRASSKTLLQDTLPPGSEQLKLAQHELDQVACWYVLKKQDDGIIVQAGRVRDELVGAMHRMEYNVRSLDDMPVVMGGHRLTAGEPIMTVQVMSTSGGFKMIVCEIHHRTDTGVIRTAKILCRYEADPGNEYFEYFPDTDQPIELTKTYLETKQMLDHVTQQVPVMQYQEALDETLKTEYLKIATQISQLMLADRAAQPLFFGRYLRDIIELLQHLNCHHQQELHTAIRMTELDDTTLRLHIPTQLLLNEHLPLLQTMFTAISSLQPTDVLVLEVNNTMADAIHYCYQDQIIAPNNSNNLNRLAQRLNFYTVPQTQQELFRLLQAATLSALQVKLPNLNACHELFDGWLNTIPQRDSFSCHQTFVQVIYFKYLKTIKSTPANQQALQANYYQLAVSLIAMLQHLSGPSRLQVLHPAALAQSLYNSNDTELATAILNTITDRTIFGQALELLSSKNYITSMTTITAIEQHPCYQQLQGWNLVYVIVDLLGNYRNYYDDLDHPQLTSLNLKQMLVLITSLANYNNAASDLMSHRKMPLPPPAIMAHLATVATDLDTVISQLQELITQEQLRQLPPSAGARVDTHYRIFEDVLLVLSHNIFPNILANMGELMRLIQLIKAWAERLGYSEIFVEDFELQVLSAMGHDFVPRLMTNFSECLQFLYSLPPHHNLLLADYAQIFMQETERLSVLLLEQLALIQTPEDWQQLLAGCAKVQQRLGYHGGAFITELLLNNLALAKIKSLVVDANYLTILYNYCLTCGDFSLAWRAPDPQQIVAICHDINGLTAIISRLTHDNSHAIELVIAVINSGVFKALINNLNDLKQLCQAITHNTTTTGLELAILSRLDYGLALQLAGQLFSLATDYTQLVKYPGYSSYTQKILTETIQHHVGLIANFADAKQWLSNIHAVQLTNPAIVPIITKHETKFLVQTITNISQLRELLTLATTNAERLTFIEYLGGLAGIKALILDLATKTALEQISIQEFGRVIGMLPETVAIGDVLAENAAKILISNQNQLQWLIAAAQPRQQQLRTYLEQFAWIRTIVNTPGAGIPKQPTAATKLVDEVAKELPQLKRFGANKK